MDPSIGVWHAEIRYSVSDQTDIIAGMPNFPLPHSLPLWPDGIPEPWPTDAPADEHAATMTVLRTHCEPQQSRPAVLIFAGGGYGHRSPREQLAIAAWIMSLGLHAVIVDYRCNGWRHPAPLNDAAQAMRQVRQHAGQWQIDPQRCAVLGFSAGGHLAASLACHHHTDSRPDLAILAYPVTLMGESYTHQGSQRHLLGDQAQPQDLDTCNLPSQVHPQVPPTFIFHTSSDSSVPVINAYRFAEACANHGVPCAMHITHRGRHGVNLAVDDPYLHRWTAEVEAWLRDWNWLG